MPDAQGPAADELGQPQAQADTDGAQEQLPPARHERAGPAHPSDQEGFHATERLSNHLLGAQCKGCQPWASPGKQHSSQLDHVPAAVERQEIADLA